MALELVSLKIPDDWHVYWNHFYDLKPEDCQNMNSPYSTELHEDIFYFKNVEKQRSLDLGWYSAGPKGKYTLYLLEIVDGEENWTKPIIKYRSKDIKKITMKIHEIFDKVQNDYIKMTE